jgi:peptidoglycan/xylan/chitin deacetylase (PgdA/CDA1 family)
MRLDRFITLSVFRPLVHCGMGPRGFQLPILMYHSISEDLEQGVSPYYRTATHPKLFADQMAMLKSQGYGGVTLNDGLTSLHSFAQPCVPRPVVLTFDDGFQDFYHSAFPILQQHGFGATVYLPTAFIGETPRQFKSRPCMTWSEVRALHRAGIEFGSHTVNHLHLVDLDWAGIEGELRDSKTEIEQRLGHSLKAFAYPYAFPQTDRAFAGQLRTTLEIAGYTSCATTQLGRVRAEGDRFWMKRLPVNSGDDLRLFHAKLTGAYDWLRLPQAMAKKAKSFVSK